MNKPSSPISFLLILASGITLLGGVIAAIQVYRFESGLVSLLPGVSGFKLDASWTLFAAGYVFFGAFIVSLVLAALAQINDSAMATAALAETQTDYLRQIAAGLSARAPGVDDTARSVAESIRLSSG
jgi:hypothetical protein